MGDPVEDSVDVDGLISRGYGQDVDLDPSLHLVGAPSTTRFTAARKTVTDADVRCSGRVESRQEPGTTKTCGKLLAQMVGRPWVIQCPRCKSVNKSPE